MDPNQKQQSFPNQPNVQAPPVQPPASPQSFEPPTPTPTPPPPPPPPQQPPVAPLPESPEETQTPPKSHPKTIFYILLLLVVIITFAALAMIYMKFAGSNTSQLEQNTNQLQEEVQIPEPTIVETDEDTKALQTQGSSDEVSDIEKDLKNTDLTNLDKELSSISSEINQ